MRSKTTNVSHPGAVSHPGSSPPFPSSTSRLANLRPPLGELLLMLPLDDRAEVAHGQTEGEIHRLKDHAEPQIPARDDRRKRTRSAAHGAVVGGAGVAGGGVEVRGAEEAEGEDEGEEDAAKADVGPEGADQIARAEEAHEDEEVGEARVELGGFGVAVDGVVLRGFLLVWAHRFEI